MAKYLKNYRGIFMRKKKLIGSLILLLLIIFIGIYYFLSANKIEVTLVSDINQGSVFLDANVSGLVFDACHQTVFFEKDKRISEIYVQAGQKVHKGDPLLKYDKTTVELTLKKIALKKEQLDGRIFDAEHQISALQNQAQRENMSKDDLDEINKQIQELNTKIESLRLEKKREDLNYAQNQTELENGILRANNDGIVKKVQNIDENLIAEDPVIEIVGENGASVKIEVSEFQMEKIDLGDKIYLNSEDMENSYEAAIVSKEGSPSRITSNITYYNVIALISDANELSAGMELTGNLETSEKFHIWLDDAYIREENGKQYVLKVDKNNKLKKAFVSLGRFNSSGSSEIVKGLKETDYIAFPYGKGVKEGASVLMKTEEQK